MLRGPDPAWETARVIEVPTIEVSQVPDPLPTGVVVVDVREPVEWEHGHIAGSVHIPLQQLPDRSEELPQDRQLLVVCKVGGRSAQATAYLRERGLDAVNLAGGLLDWADAGRPLESEDAGPGRVA